LGKGEKWEIKVKMVGYEDNGQESNRKQMINIDNRKFICGSSVKGRRIYF
jgi:hypothetical protein